MCYAPKRRLALLGSTGSIGRNALDVVRYAKGRLQVVAMSAHANISLLAEQIREFRPQTVAVTGITCDSGDLIELHDAAKLAKTEVLYGPESLCELVTRDEIDVVVSAVVGSAGLQSTLRALETGKTVALANKESLVVGGELVVDTAKKHKGQIIPVDSEHSAIWQCLAAGKATEVTKIILTASGGPFRNLSQAELQQVTVADALAHPTWNMGKKITIDSATLMNKALEIIEARWLFDMPPEKIGVVIHPQSVVHSMVEFVDGSVIAQLGLPDMRLPIQWAIDYPERFPGPARKLDWSESLSLEFSPPDFERFPALQLGLEVAEQAGTSGAVVSAANEVAVEAFLQERLPFHQITTVCQSILKHHNHERRPTLEQLLAADRWARLETEKWISR